MEGRKIVKATSIGSSSSSDVAGGDSCVICMSAIELAKRTQINCCTHVFCYECIHAWSKEKSICPLCKRIFSEMSFTRAAVAVIEKVECVYKPPATHDGPALDCLDSQYFLAEIGRLLSTAEQTQRTWFKERRQNPTMYRHKHSNTFQEKHWDLLEESINRLHFLRIQLSPQTSSSLSSADHQFEMAIALSMSSSNSSPNDSGKCPSPGRKAIHNSNPQFDSFVMLQELYQLQDTLQEIYAARCFVNSNNPQQQQSASASSRSTHNEEEYYEEEEEDDYYDDGYYEDDENDRSYVAAATAATRRLALSDYVKSPAPSKSSSKTSTPSKTTPTKASPNKAIVTASPAAGKSSKRP